MPRGYRRLLKTPSESFDGLRTNGSEFEIIEKNPFMLVEACSAFFSSLLTEPQLHDSASMA
jgi:hypothetical protein